MRRMLLIRIAVALAGVLAVIGGRSLATSGAAPVDRPGPDPAMAAFTARAAAAAGGRVEGPAVTVTASTLLVRYDRGDCRVLMRLDRRAAPTAANAALDTGPRCPTA